MGGGNTEIQFFQCLAPVEMLTRITKLQKQKKLFLHLGQRGAEVIS